MSILENISRFLPGVEAPTQRKLGFKEKLKWTLIILGLFFVFGQIMLFGLGDNQLKEFESLSIILGAEFGSIISLGIGPLVTASIVLQLLQGSGLLKMNVHEPEGRKKFQTLQKVLGIFFIIFEAIIYVYMGGLSPQGFVGLVTKGDAVFGILQVLLVFQLILGGIMILFMDEVISKWGFGSGISLFIAAGVSKEIFIRAFSWLHPVGDPSAYIGAVPEFFRALAIGEPQLAALAIASIIATIVVFLISVFTQAMKIEIPLSFGKIRGQSIRWPLKFMYTSNIPVILVAALLANIQLWARLLDKWGHPWLGSFSSSGAPESGIVQFINAPQIISKIIQGNIAAFDFVQALIYLGIMVVGSCVFAWFWMQTAGMDPRTQAENIMNSGLQIPGFRKDTRILEKILERYIYPLTIMGAMTVGFLAAIADLSGALSRGTGILLTVMIIYGLYEDIAKHHMMDIYPGLKKMME